MTLDDSFGAACPDCFSVDAKAIKRSERLWLATALALMFLAEIATPLRTGIFTSQKLPHPDQSIIPQKVMVRFVYN